MLTDLAFWLFLAASVVVFWLLPARIRMTALSVASLCFVAYVAPVSAALLVVLSVAVWLLLPRIAARSRIAFGVLLATIAGIAGPLILLKITQSYGIPWLDGSLLRYAVPLGMSYYAFRLIHLVIDAYRFGERPRSAVEFFAYAFLFTIFAAGPIQRYDAFIAERSPAFSPALIRDGLMRIMLGLIKQGVLIELLHLVRRRLLGDEFHLLHGADLLAAPAGQVWVLLIIVYLTAYLNLGAYTDVAIGASRLFGFRISENFNYPIAARNLSDFWRRWHMTLSGWCQTYVFSPVLGVTRQPYIALIASFQVMGLWHLLTLNRVAWGLFQATGLIVLYAWRKRAGKRKSQTGATWYWAGLAWLLTQSFATLGFIFVQEESSNDVVTTLRILVHVASFGLLT